MKEFTYTITDPLGIHARPAGQVAKLAKGYGDTVITISKNGSVAKASQLMKLMSLAIKQGDTVLVTAEGPREEEAMEALKAFFAANL